MRDADFRTNYQNRDGTVPTSSNVTRLATFDLVKTAYLDISRRRARCCSSVCLAATCAFAIAVRARSAAILISRNMTAGGFDSRLSMVGPTLPAEYEHEL